jgi:DNA-binding transcriptional LysR family regulator
MAEEQHFTKAADRLHISQPSLSYSISELEKELNLPLFERRNNKTNITRYAEELLPYVQAALGKFDDIQIKAYELSDPSVGTVNLGMIYSISFDFLPKLLERFYADKDNGRINVNLFQGVNMTLTNKLLEGGLDLILSGESEEAGISGAYLFTQDLKLIVPENHPLAGKREVSLKDVKDEGLVSLGETSHISGHITRCFRCRGYEPKFVLNVAECSAMGAFISSNMCVAIAPVVPSLQSCAVKIIPFCKDDRALLSRKIFLRWETSRYLPPAVRKFHDFVLRKFCEVEN